MTTTPRAAIRAAVQQALQGPDDGTAPPTDAGRKVYASRAVPIARRLLPAILVYTRDERRDQDVGAGAVRRLLDVVVETAAQGADADAQVDRLSAQVETALAAAPTLGGAVESITWQATEADYDGEGAQTLAAARLDFQAVYYTLPAEEAEPPLPSGVYVSWAPDIGIPHEPDYVDVEVSPLPDIVPSPGLP